MSEVSAENVKGFMSHVMDKLTELEVAARKLPNHHLADLIKASHGRLVSAAGHPDLDLSALQLGRDERDAGGGKPAPFPSSDDPNHDGPAFIPPRKDASFGQTG